MTIEDALRKAFQLGQIYWQQADSDSYRQQDKSDETKAKFEELVAEMKVPEAPKDCPVCDGWGSVSTGIDEAPSTLCKACDGNGSLPR